MKKIHVALIALVILAVSAGSAFGHIGETKFMFQFPDGLTPTLDGDPSDWDIVTDAYKINAENMFNQFAAPLDLGDFNAWVAWGYNLSENRAYLACWAFDDMAHGSEHFSVEVDWDHSGEQYRAFEQGDDYEARWINAHNQKYDVAAPAQDPSGYFVKMSGKEWVAEEPSTEWGGKFLTGAPDTFEPAEFFVELRLTPWDDAHPDGPDASIQHVFKEGDIVGLEVNRGDKDADPGAYDDAYWSTFGGVNAWEFADQFGDYLLAPVEAGLPTAVEATTWAHIKSSFATE
jgi:hypothetical protein